MLKRAGGYFVCRKPDDVPDASRQLESEGYAVLREVLTPAEVEALKQEITAVFADYDRDNRAGQFRPNDEDNMFRYEMFNRSALSQTVIGHPAILSVIEPLLGEDCHVIANTAWRNQAHHKGTHGGQGWHIDAGPHIPLPEDVQWPATIPHPVFAIGAHIFLQDCGMDDGPTGVLPGSHLSGRFPPPARAMDATLNYQGRSVVPLIARAGDVGLFVSDVWHRRMPAGDNDQGRFFLQVHYGRRDIAQRVKPTDAVNHVSDAARERAQSHRDRTLIGLHLPQFYDG